MSLRLTWATANRVLSQLSHDPRTLALMLVVPVALLSLLAWIYNGSGTFDRIGPPLLGVFPFVVMFLVTSVATLRERTSGSLERLLTLPIGKLDLLVGYGVAFGLVAVLQSVLAAGVGLFVLGMDVQGAAWVLVLVALVNAWLGTALGLLVSAFAASEFQAVQFLPAVILPQFLLCGLLVPRESLPRSLELLSGALPLSYAVDALYHVASEVSLSADVVGDLLLTLAFTATALVAGATTLRRRTE